MIQQADNINMSFAFVSLWSAEYFAVVFKFAIFPGLKSLVSGLWSLVFGFLSLVSVDRVIHQANYTNMSFCCCLVVER